MPNLDTVDVDECGSGKVVDGELVGPDGLPLRRLPAYSDGLLRELAAASVKSSVPGLDGVSRGVPSPSVSNTSRTKSSAGASDRGFASSGEMCGADHALHGMPGRPQGPVILGDASAAGADGGDSGGSRGARKVREAVRVCADTARLRLSAARELKEAVRAYCANPPTTHT